jgi:hypothetical protein
VENVFCHSLDGPGCRDGRRTHCTYWGAWARMRGEPIAFTTQAMSLLERTNYLL